jgi:hypothetical protein
MGYDVEFRGSEYFGSPDLRVFKNVSLEFVLGCFSVLYDIEQDGIPNHCVCENSNCGGQYNVTCVTTNFDENISHHMKRRILASYDFRVAYDYDRDVDFLTTDFLFSKFLNSDEIVLYNEKRNALFLNGSIKKPTMRFTVDMEFGDHLFILQCETVDFARGLETICAWTRIESRAGHRKRSLVRMYDHSSGHARLCRKRVTYFTTYHCWVLRCEATLMSFVPRDLAAIVSAFFKGQCDHGDHEDADECRTFCETSRCLHGGEEGFEVALELLPWNS